MTKSEGSVVVDSCAIREECSPASAVNPCTVPVGVIAVNVTRVKGGGATIDRNASTLNKVRGLSVSQRG